MAGHRAWHVIAAQKMLVGKKRKKENVSLIRGNEHEQAVEGTYWLPGYSPVLQADLSRLSRRFQLWSAAPALRHELERGHGFHAVLFASGMPNCVG